MNTTIFIQLFICVDDMKTRSKVSHGVMLRLVLKTIFLNFTYLIFFGKISNLYFYLPSAALNSMDQKQKVESNV